MLKSLFKTPLGKIDFTTIITLVCLILSTVGIDPISLQSWNDVGQVVMSVFTNPYKIALIIGSVFGWYRNNQSKNV